MLTMIGDDFRTRARRLGFDFLFAGNAGQLTWPRGSKRKVFTAFAGPLADAERFLADMLATVEQILQQKRA